MRISIAMQLRTATAIAGFMTLGLLSALGANTASADFYVALNGNDAWSGKLAAPNPPGTDGPFATQARARNAVRALKAAGGVRTSLTVMIRGGKYFLPNPLTFTGDDSGTAEAPVTYQAYPGEQPVLSGGRRVTGWKPYRGQILMADLPGSTGASGNPGSSS